MRPDPSDWARVAKELDELSTVINAMGTDLAVTFRATIGRNAQALEATSPSAQF
jgi:hypothetical protein